MMNVSDDYPVGSERLTGEAVMTAAVASRPVGRKRANRALCLTPAEEYPVGSERLTGEHPERLSLRPSVLVLDDPAQPLAHW